MGGLGDIVKFADPTYYGTGMKKSYLAEGMGLSTSESTNREYKQAAEAADQRNQAAIKEMKDAQAAAGEQAKAAINARRRAVNASQTIFTSPLGIGGMASTARKTLLGQ